MQYACSSALRERKGEGEGKERKRVHFLTSAFNFSTNFPLSGTSLSLEVCAGCVCVKHFFCLFLPLFSPNPLGACLVFLLP